MAMKKCSAFPKLQHHWNLTIRLFSVISRTLVGEFLLLCGEAVGVLYSTSQLGKLGWVLWYINHCRLFNAKSFSYIYIKYRNSKHILSIKLLNVLSPLFLALSNMLSLISINTNILFTLIICLHTVKCFQVLLFNSNNSIKRKSFIYRQLNYQTVLF